ncbi:MAG: 2,3-epoxybenzoyl-CoA dihydrolase [Planctomycetota bacterium]|nr:2,3-epoxybenzoyl-CoA dihydrolase [Planctomycetota bacterium]
MIQFHTSPDHYKHWQLTFDGDIARLDMNVQDEFPFKEGYELKLNSYDLGVDIELADAVQRIRFEHPEVKVVQIGSAVERVFCAGANIPMLGASTHSFKVNFCKFTNETRLSIEDTSRHSGVKFVAALNGPCAGGGYELALACDEIYLINDGNSAVSLPEVPLLGVLPGTGGLTRVVDKRMVRRDRADIFSSLEEGFKGKKAKAWNLVDDTFPTSKFEEKVTERCKELAASLPTKAEQGIALGPVTAEVEGNTWKYKHVTVECDPTKRVATLTLEAPTTAQPASAEDYLAAGDGSWAMTCFRELDDALLHLRFEQEEVGLIVLNTRGDMDAILEVEKTLAANKDHWFVNEVIAQIARVMRRYELSARSLFALADAGSCFGGLFLELALASDRVYMLDDPDNPVEMAIGALSDGYLTMSNGLTRLQSRFLANPEHAAKLAKEMPRVEAPDAEELGLVTVLGDEFDFEDDTRIAIEERASLSPDALTGMEASLRFAGPETCDSKIFGRLSAWQNWIFIRPNATGPEGALTRYGQPEQANFDWRRT